MSNPRALVIIGATVIVGLLVDAHLEAPVIFGGSVCETTNGIEACFGYPPTGIFVIFFAVAMAGYGVDRGYRAVTAYLERLISA